MPELDSLAVAEPAASLEEEFGFEIGDEDCTGEVFETVGTVVAFVQDTKSHDITYTWRRSSRLNAWHQLSHPFSPVVRYTGTTLDLILDSATPPLAHLGKEPS